MHGENLKLILNEYFNSRTYS